VACPTQSFPLSPTDFADCATKLQSQHNITIDVNSDSGIINADGCAVEWKYDGKTLTTTLVSKPFIISCGHANAAIAEFFNPNAR
jgi:hypothetical protein